MYSIKQGDNMPDLILALTETNPDTNVTTLIDLSQWPTRTGRCRLKNSTTPETKSITINEYDDVDNDPDKYNAIHSWAQGETDDWSPGIWELEVDLVNASGDKFTVLNNGDPYEFRVRPSLD